MNERELYNCLHGGWEPNFKLFPHLPFENLIDLDYGRLDAVELNYLHKTTVDFVLVTSEGRPLLGIEFDGMGHGFSKDGQYHQLRPSSDKNRSWKLSLKARVAYQAAFPFTIVSYDEKAIVDEDSQLTIVHGIIGAFLARSYAQARMQELYAENEEFIEDLSPVERYEYVQDYVVISAEVEADFAFNPIVKKAGEYQKATMALMPIISWSEYYPQNDRPPNTDPLAPDFDMASLSNWMDNRPKEGATITITTMFGVIERTAWVRNVDTPGTTPLSLAREIGQLLAWRDALQLVRARMGANHETAS
jgi:hypothetical protein